RIYRAKYSGVERMCLVLALPTSARRAFDVLENGRFLPKDANFAKAPDSLPGDLNSNIAYQENRSWESFNVACCLREPPRFWFRASQAPVHALANLDLAIAPKCSSRNV